MTSRPWVRIAAACFLAFPLSSASFTAEQAQPNHTLTFAELTHGTTIYAMAPASGGGAWFGGSTCSTTLPTTPDAVQPTKASGCHGVLGRLAADGAVSYLSYLGGTQGPVDTVTALA